MPFLSKCTEELIDAIAEHVASGLPFRDACALAGVSRQAAYKWLKDAEEDFKDPDKARALYVRFAESVGVARAKFKRECLAAIKTGAPGWQSRAWLLERCYPADFSTDRSALRVIAKDLAEMSKLVDELLVKVDLKRTDVPPVRKLAEIAAYANTDGMDDEGLDEVYSDDDSE